MMTSQLHGSGLHRSDIQISNSSQKCQLVPNRLMSLKIDFLVEGRNIMIASMIIDAIGGSQKTPLQIKIYQDIAQLSKLMTLMISPTDKATRRLSIIVIGVPISLKIGKTVLTRPFTITKSQTRFKQNQR